MPAAPRAANAWQSDPGSGTGSGDAVQRLKTRAQFQALLASPVVARTAHFAVHLRRLSTARATLDDLAGHDQALFPVPGPWLGAMIPKRWARRAVTRNLFKRQIYQVSQLFDQKLPHSAHLVRLRAQFDRQQFHSASSEALRRASREELLRLFEQLGMPASARP